MSLAKAIVQVSGDTDKPNGYSTQAELQLSIEIGHEKKLWIRLDPDSTGRADYYQFRGTTARVLAAILIEFAETIEREETTKGKS